MKIHVINKLDIIVVFLFVSHQLIFAEADHYNIMDLNTRCSMDGCFANDNFENGSNWMYDFGQWPRFDIKKYNKVSDTLSISGIITGAGEPLDTVKIKLFISGEYTAPIYTDIITDTSGNYAIDSLPAGNYILLATPCNNDTLFFDSIYYGQEMTPELAQIITLSDTKLYNIDIDMTRNSTLAFTVEGFVYAGTEPLASGWVELIDTSVTSNLIFATDITNGFFYFKRVLSGYYVLLATPGEVYESMYMPTYGYNTTDREAAWVFQVDGKIGGIDLYLMDISEPTIIGGYNQSATCFFPNPCKNILNVILSDQQLPVRIKCMNLEGQILFDHTYSNEYIEIETRRFDEGIYIIQLLSNTSNTTQTLIIQR